MQQISPVEDHSLPRGVSFGEIANMGTVIIRPLGKGKGFEVVDKLQIWDISEK